MKNKEILHCWNS